MAYSAAICVLLIALAGVSVQGSEFSSVRGMFPTSGLVPCVLHIKRRHIFRFYIFVEARYLLN